MCDLTLVKTRQETSQKTFQISNSLLTSRVNEISFPRTFLTAQHNIGSFVLASFDIAVNFVILELGNNRPGCGALLKAIPNNQLLCLGNKKLDEFVIDSVLYIDAGSGSAILSSVI